MYTSIAFMTLTKKAITLTEWKQLSLIDYIVYKNNTSQETNRKGNCGF